MHIEPERRRWSCDACGRPWRVVRADYDRLGGYLAYADRRSSAADRKYGGSEGARTATDEWLSEPGWPSAADRVGTREVLDRREVPAVPRHAAS
jgi:hypothetical protein